jgi:hypothetical protein
MAMLRVVLRLNKRQKSPIEFFIIGYENYLSGDYGEDIPGRHVSRTYYIHSHNFPKECWNRF